MAFPRKLISTLSYIIFFGGSLIGLFVIGSAVWGDLEAAMLGRPLGAEKNLNNLRCPIFVSTDEIGEAYVWIRNDTDKPIKRTIRSHLSNYYISLIDSVDTSVSLEQGEKARITWSVDPADALYGRFYIIRIYMFSGYKTQSQEGSCGIMVIDLPFSGKQVVTYSTLLCLLGMGLGFLLQNLGGDRCWDRRDKILGFMIVLESTGLIVSFLGWWLAGGIIMLIFVLLIGANLVRFYN
jgi:hypothetical protein